FDPAMRMPREPSQIILGNVVAEIVQEKEWIEVGCIAESESAAKMHAGAFERRLGLDESLYGSNGHFGLLAVCGRTVKFELLPFRYGALCWWFSRLARHKRLFLVSLRSSPMRQPISGCGSGCRR